MYTVHTFEFNPFNAGTDFRRQNGLQILTSKVDPRTERINIFIMALDP